MFKFSLNNILILANECAANTGGKKFLIAHLENNIGQVYISITRLTNSPTSVTIRSPFRNLNNQLVITTKSRRILVSSDYMIKDSTITNKVISVTSNFDISVLVFVSDGSTNSGYTMALPVENIPRSPTYRITNYASSDKSAQFAVLSDVQASVTVEVPTGKRLLFNGAIQSGSFTFNLAPMRAVLIFNALSDGTDISGIKITANAPIVIYSGNSNPTVGPAVSTDHLISAIPPVETWGVSFAVMAPLNRRPG